MEATSLSGAGNELREYGASAEDVFFVARFDIDGFASSFHCCEQFSRRGLAGSPIRVGSGCQPDSKGES